MVRSVHIARPRLQIQSDLGLSRESMRYMHALHKPGELLQFSRAVVPNNRHQNQRAAVVHHLLPILHHVSQGITGRKWETGTEVRWSVGGWLGRSESRRTGSLCDGSFQPIAAKIVQQMSRKSAQLVDRGVRKVSERVIIYNNEHLQEWGSGTGSYCSAHRVRGRGLLRRPGHIQRCAITSDQISQNRPWRNHVVLGELWRGRGHKRSLSERRHGNYY